MLPAVAVIGCHRPTLTTHDAPQAQLTRAQHADDAKPTRYPQSAKPSRSSSITMVIYQNREKNSFIVIRFL